MKDLKMEPTPIPFNFVCDRLSLTWADMAWGYQKGWLDALSVVEYAVVQAVKDDGADPAVIELAGLTRMELGGVAPLLEQICGEMRYATQRDSERKWLYLVLSWIFARRDEMSDPLGAVEELYADFGYPPELRSFVRYMPPEDHFVPQAHTPAENSARLFANWAKYLDSFATAQ